MSGSVSVIVPTIDGGEALKRCVRSVADQGQDGVELIIVDNGSTDGSVEEAAAIVPATRVIRNEANRGFAPACNQGARESNRDWILFLNSDAELSVGAIRKLTESAQSLGAAIIQPMILDQEGMPDSAGDLFTRSGFMWHLTDRPQGSRPLFSIKGACMLVERKVFEELGGFDDSYFAYFEETDLCWRARMNGHRVFVDPNVEVRHVGGFTTRRILAPERIYHLSFRNRLRSVIANPSPASLVFMLPLHLIGCLGTILTFALRGQAQIAVAIAKAIVWPLAHLPEMRAQRQRRQSKRRVSDAQVFAPDVTVGLTAARAMRLLKGTLGRWTGG